MSGNVFYLNWEPQFAEWLQKFLGEFGETVMPFISNFGEELLMVAVFCFFYFCYDKEKGIIIGTALMTVQTWNPMIKNIFLRRRPYMVHGNIRCLRPANESADLMDCNAQGFSFPSGHSGNVASCYGMIARLYRKKWIRILSSALILLVGISRITLGVHYPTDVLAGYLLGVILLFLTDFLFRRIRRKSVIFLICFVSSVPGLFYCSSTDYFTGFGLLTGLFLGALLEERFVRFRVTRIWWRALLRLTFVIGLFYGLNVLLKLPFPGEMLEAEDLTAHLLRSLRYIINICVCMAVYPLSFRILDRKLKVQ